MCLFCIYLTGRSWKGLEKRLGEVGVVSAVEGRRGVASAYSHEHSFTKRRLRHDHEKLRNFIECHYSI